MSDCAAQPPSLQFPSYSLRPRAHSSELRGRLSHLVD